MKRILLAASAALMLMAQDAKIQPPATPAVVTPIAPPEAVLTQEESLQLENSMVHIALLNKQYKIDEYQKDISPFVATEDKVLFEKCKALGIPEEKVRAECGLMGFGQDGGPITGQDGKPIVRKVWWNKPKMVSAAGVIPAAKPEPAPGK